MKQKIFHWKTYDWVQETPGTITVIFDTGQDDFVYKAGQFVNVSLPIGETMVTRSYTLSSCPGVDERPAITVKKVEGGLMSGYMTANAASIREWMVEGPFGAFCPLHESPQHPVVMIGGGSGITPLYAMLKNFLHFTSCKILLIDANRLDKDVLFGEHLHKLELQYANRLKVWHLFSKMPARSKTVFENVRNRRPDASWIKKTVKHELGASCSEAIYYLCGPPGLITLAEEALLSMGVSPDRLMKEYFQPLPVISPGLQPDGRKWEVLLHYFEQSNLLEVHTGQTILEAALADRVPVRYSCKNGTCGVCQAKLLSGDVHMTNNFSLTKEMVGQGYVLLCQSHPQNNEVTVEVNAME